MIEIIKEQVSPVGAEQVVVRKGNKYFVVSSVNAMFTGFETLVFPSDAEGNITNFHEVAGGRGMSREEAIAELEGI